MLGRFGDLLERIESGRRRKLLLLLARRPMTEAELSRHFLFPLTLRWHLRELHELGLIAYNRRADRYHLVWPALEELAAFCAELDQAPAGQAAVAALSGPAQSIRS